MNLQLRAAAYVRVASAAFDHRLTLFGQTQVIRQWAEENYCELVRVYSDIGSGNTANRPGLQAMLVEARAGAFDVILVTNWARLFRNLALMVDCRRLLTEEYGVDVIAIEMGGGAR